MAFLKFERVSKRFPGVIALEDITLEVARGSCHALVGENGAGKSTIGKILAGVYRADSGAIFLEDRRIHPSDPLAARRLGIVMVHQELAFCPNLSIAENLCLGELPRTFGWLRRNEMRERARRMLHEIGADFDVDRPIGELTTGQEQMVQIAAALGAEAKVIVMDEPTSSLSAHESEGLFSLLQRLRVRDITILYVSHRMNEIFRLCDTITVLRDGRHVATEEVGRTSTDRVVHQMIGREVAGYEPKSVSQPSGAPLLQVEDLASPGKFSDVSFELHAGEFVGMAGLVGAGRTEVAQALFGLDPRATGRIWVQGEELKIGDVKAALAAGLGLLPEDRKRQGLVLGMNCRENSSLAALKRLSRLGFVNRSAERSLAEEYVRRLGVRTPSTESPVAGLSGGNQQKIALAKWLARRCRVLIVDEPTRGVDVGAKAEIHQLLDELAVQGLGVLLISSELPEVMAMSHRALVFREGRIVREVERKDFTEADLMRLMAGVKEAA